MAKVSVVPSSQRTAAAAGPPRLELVETPRCSLCGEPLPEGRSFSMVSPFLANTVTVCRACHRAALGEGYSPKV